MVNLVNAYFGPLLTDGAMAVMNDILEPTISHKDMVGWVGGWGVGWGVGWGGVVWCGVGWCGVGLGWVRVCAIRPCRFRAFGCVLMFGPLDSALSVWLFRFEVRVLNPKP